MTTWHEVRVCGHVTHLATPRLPGWMGTTGPVWSTACGRRVYSPDHVANLGTPADTRPPGLPCAVTCKDCRKVYRRDSHQPPP